MKQNDLDFNRLQQVLDEWQPGAEPSAGFDAALQRRLANLPQASARAPRPWFAGLWPRLAAAGTLAVALGLFFYLGQQTTVPEEAAITQAAMVRDLQLLNRNSELLEHLDFLAVPGQPTVRGQD